MTAIPAISRNGDTLLLQGNISFNTVAALSDLLRKELTADIKTVDCSGISHADSSAISLLIDCLSLTRDRAVPLRICGINQAVRSLVDLYGVADFFQ